MTYPSRVNSRTSLHVEAIGAAVEAAAGAIVGAGGVVVQLET
jgi:hypothetical protein